MSVLNDIEILARISGQPESSIVPAMRILSCDNTTALVDNTAATMTVPEGYVFVVTHGDADAFPLDAALNPMFADRQSNPPYGDAVQLFYTRQGSQKHRTTELLRVFTGDVFHLFEEGQISFTTQLNTDEVKAALSLVIWFVITFRGYLVPMPAMPRLSLHQLQVLGA